MDARQERRREQWRQMSPELRQALGGIAFSTPDTITPELKERIQEEALQDLIEEEAQGEQ